MDEITSQMAYFCGFGPDCRSTKSAARLAMYNVERNYAVGGVTEDMDTTVRVLEAYVPRLALHNILI